MTDDLDSDDEQPPLDRHANGKSRPPTTAQVMADILRQEKEQRSADISDHTLITSDELISKLGIDAEQLRTSLRTHKLFSVPVTTGVVYYPEFFVTKVCPREMLEKVCQSLGNMPGRSKWDFFNSPKTSLGGLTPLTALAQGRLLEVLASAARVAASDARR